MITIIVTCMVIVLVVLLLSVLTTSKAYSYKHTVDPIENNPHLNNDSQASQENNKNDSYSE